MQEYTTPFLLILTNLESNLVLIRLMWSVLVHCRCAGGEPRTAVEPPHLLPPDAALACFPSAAKRARSTTAPTASPSSKRSSHAIRAEQRGEPAVVKSPLVENIHGMPPEQTNIIAAEAVLPPLKRNQSAPQTFFNSPKIHQKDSIAKKYTCRKSPPSKTIFPPNGCLMRVRSRMVRSTQAICSLFAIGVSSQTMNLAWRMSFASADCAEMEPTDVSFTLETGILKRLCAVRPPCSSSAAMPDDATASAISPLDRQ